MLKLYYVLFTSTPDDLQISRTGVPNLFYFIVLVKVKVQLHYKVISHNRKRPMLTKAFNCMFSQTHPHNMALMLMLAIT